MSPMNRSRLKVTSGPLKHARYIEALEVFGRMCSSATDGMVLGLVGPSHVGKSLVLESIVAQMKSETKGAPQGLIPVVRLQVESVNEGRVRSKWLDLQLLKQLHHPVYMHIGEMDEKDHYAPSRGRDEASLRNALKVALGARGTSRVVLDEAHLLTRTVKSDLRGNILESLKSIAAIERTLILCGGYELAYMGLFDNPHFIGRTIIYEFSAYESTPEDLKEWARIVKSFGSYLSLSPGTLLMERTEALLKATNGVLGLLEKWLWACKAYAEAKGRPIDLATLRMWAPSINEQRIIADDIKKGKDALRLLPLANSRSFPSATTTSPHSVNGSDGEPPRRRSDRKPFQRSPKRTEMAGLEVYIDD